jgi:hypothetical protein
VVEVPVLLCFPAVDFSKYGELRTPETEMESNQNYVTSVARMEEVRIGGSMSALSWGEGIGRSGAAIDHSVYPSGRALVKVTNS